MVDYLRRYQIATAEHLASRRFEGLANEQEARQFLIHLAEHGWLDEGQILPRKGTTTYFYLSSQAAERVDNAEPITGQRTLDERLARWAIAQFCAGEEPFRELMTGEEFRSRFVDLWKPSESAHYYLEPEGGVPRLAYLKVDLGGSSQWDRVVDSCLRFLTKRIEGNDARAELFRRLIDHGRFQISLLVSCPDKAEAIKTRLDLDATETGTRPPVVPYVVPGLLELLLQSALQKPGSKRRNSSWGSRRSA
jgi:hypothetical protein